ncbi:hypothetical protein Q8A49_06285 [Nocardiopsis umidischolae]|uniref:Uncharacterized protein n=1 Tax=Nocardiopsis tropica TaxID=109330 RepID=A0ABU7KLD0_9ACTN|nr:hypothetical protein [Nocardiopsis umidischolae]
MSVAPSSRTPSATRGRGALEDERIGVAPVFSSAPLADVGNRPASAGHGAVEATVLVAAIDAWR